MGAVLSAGMIFGAGFECGVRLACAAETAWCDALDAVDRAAEAVKEYLRAVKKAYEDAKAFVASAWQGFARAARSARDGAASAAACAFEKVKEAASFLRDRVVRFFRRLCGRKKAAAVVKRELDDRAAQAAQAQRAGSGAVFACAAANIVRSRRRIMEVAPCGALVPAAPLATCGALALRESVPFVATRRAAERAAEMMALIVETFVAEADLGDSIPAAARSSITVIAAAAALCLDVVVSPIAAAAAVNAQA